MASGNMCTPTNSHSHSRRFCTSPKQFLTWSATVANSRLQKMSKNLVYSVSKLGTKMEKALPNFHQHSSSNLSLDSGGFNSRFNSIEDLSSTVVTVVKSEVPVKGILVKRNIDSGLGDKDKNFKTANQIPLTRRKSSADISKRTEFESDQLNNNVNVNLNNNNNLNTVNQNNLNFGGRRLINCSLDMVSRDREECRNNIVLEMRSGQCFYAGNGNSNGFRNHGGKDEEEIENQFTPLERRLNNCSSSTISSAATTLPIMSPQGSRASSVSISSSGLVCDYNPGGPNNSPGVKRRSGRRRGSNNGVPGPDSHAECGDNNVVLVRSGPSSKSLSSASPSSSSSPSSSFSSPSTSSSSSSAILFNGPLQTSVCSSSAPSTQVTLQLLSTDPLSAKDRALPSKVQVPASSLSLDKRSKSFSSSHPSKVMSQTLPSSKLAVTTLEEEQQLRHAPWFQAGIPREIALEVLRNEPFGSFIVRESTTKTGCFALSLRVPREAQPTGIAHYLILKTGRGYKIKGFTKEFGSLTSLITHHSVMPELLPCPLSLHRYRPKHPQRISRMHSSDFVEPEKLLNTFYTARKYTDF